MFQELFGKKQYTPCQQISKKSKMKTTKIMKEIQNYRVSQKTNNNLFDFGPFLVFWTRSKVVQKGSKGTKMVNPSVFDHLRPFWAHLDSFGPFQTKINFFVIM